jgi:hypothetical protein
MNRKLAETIARGPEWLLREFVNLPPDGKADGIKAYEAFRSLYGDLWGPDYPASDYYDLVRAFRIHWMAKTEQQLVSFIEKLFAGQLKPAKLGDERYLGMKLTSRAGTVRLPVETLVDILASRRAPHDFKPRTLLDYLAVWLLTFRRQRKLAFCELKGCPRPYYVKDHPRHRYCSQTCSHEAKIRREVRWWHDNRGSRAKAIKGKG